MTPAGTSNELDVQNEWEENMHNTHTMDVALDNCKAVKTFCFSPCRVIIFSICRGLRCIVIIPMRASEYDETLVAVVVSVGVLRRLYQQLRVINAWGVLG